MPPSVVPCDFPSPPPLQLNHREFVLSKLRSDEGAPALVVQRIIQTSQKGLLLPFSGRLPFLEKSPLIHWIIHCIIMLKFSSWERRKLLHTPCELFFIASRIGSTS